jgi:hypothetical protein
MHSKYYGICVVVFVAGCLATTFATQFEVERQRAEEQQQRGVDQRQLIEGALDELGDSAPESVKANLTLAVELADDVTKNAQVTREWNVASGTILPPKEPVEPNTEQENVDLAMHKRKADTVGKARRAGHAARAAFRNRSGGGISGWLMGGGFTAVVTALGGAAELQRRKSKKQDAKIKQQEEQRKLEREQDRAAQLQAQKDRDEQQDLKLNVFMAELNGKIEELQSRLPAKGKA